MAVLLLFAAPAAAQEALRGTWRGGYDCGAAQGHTALVLTMDPRKDGTVSALFHFEAAADNPGVPTGCFAMEGRFDPATREVSLRHLRWLLQPANYVMVDLAGRLSDAGDRIEGRVIHASCSTFAVERLAGRSDAEACRTGAPLLSLR
ncbi:hypothetical protein AAFN86_25415 [Roseomonas sp. CAU 1739]|uniref:hypothetical protein n=1 Tax=Roseomonas sp. CAU 1739 TaxID=3140364 RepID=UPI00325BFA20